MNIQFLGAAKVVTGSNILVTTKDYQFIIDCGLFQGSEDLENLNYEDFKFDPKEIDFMLLSHAHIDHCGRIPKLVKDGFRGKIYCTNATYDLADIMLKDSGYIQESDTQWINKSRRRSGKEPVEPLYSVEDAENSLRYFEPVLYDQKVEINGGISVRFKDAGHILGSSIIEIWIEEKKDTAKIVFSGDLGTSGKPLIRDPEFIDEADYLIMESTYGDREHENKEFRMKRLMEIINETVSNNGTVIIPSFAVGRTQELIYELNKYYAEHDNLEEFLKIPIYIDSPMAISATEIFRKNSYAFDKEARDYILKGDNPLKFDNLYFVRDHKESMRLNEADYPKVIISASGMCTAGRVRHHLKHNLWKEKNAVVFVGYQAHGTLGRILQEGATSVKLLGENIAVTASIHSVEGFSGHADQKDLLRWIGKFKKKPKRIFLVHGESNSSEALKELIFKKYHIDSYIPSMGYSFTIEESVLKEESGEMLLPVERKERIKNELEEVLNQFRILQEKTEYFLDDIVLENEYDHLKNKLIALQRELMDIAILIGK